MTPCARCSSPIPDGKGRFRVPGLGEFCVRCGIPTTLINWLRERQQGAEGGR